jgi:signal transduction histidine kinase/CheY-like chemotaxis protein
VKAFDWASLLQDHSFLSGLDDKNLVCILSDDISIESTYEAGAVIVREGDPGDSLFLIGEGSAEAVLSAGGDQTIVLSRMTRGETFGEMGFFERRPRSATVRACESCVVLEIRGEGMRALADAHPDVGFKVLLRVSERLRSKNEQILSLHLRGVEASNRAKDEFMAMLGHELRNPLGAITTAIHILDTLGHPDDKAAPLRGIVARQTQHLTHLVEDLLDVSKLVSGKIVLHRRAMDLREVAVRALASFQDAGRTTQHCISLTGAPVRVLGDPTRLEQVVSNLLDNAVKYTPPGGRVEVTILADGPDAVLTVRDTGVGIHRDALPTIFDLFVQARQTLDRAQGGLGLGLTIVRRLVELHSGTISASSAGPNLGSEFSVRLPRVSHEAVEPQPTARTLGASRARHILIIEDNRDFRVGLRMLLESWGHRVEEAATGPDGLEILQRVQPDVALIDLGLPGIDGYAVAQHVRSIPGGHAMVLVAITGYGRAEDRHRAERAGFDAHLTKPVQPHELAEVLRSGH